MAIYVLKKVFLVHLGKFKYVFKIFSGVYVLEKFPRFFSVHYRVLEHGRRPIGDIVLINMS